MKNEPADNSDEVESDVVWDGTTKAESLNDWAMIARQTLANAARNYAWPEVFEVLKKHGEFINTTRLGGKSRFAPLHQAAHGGAPSSIVEKLISMGAWRTLQNSRGERPVDVAVRTKHDELVGLLEPVYRHRVPLGILLRLQSVFHEVIIGRVERFVREHSLRLPELEPLLELDHPKMWFPVPGMCGGFSYWLESEGVDAKLVAESWSRTCDGSGQRHAVTPEGAVLVEEGFV